MTQKKMFSKYMYLNLVNFSETSRDLLFGANVESSFIINSLIDFLGPNEGGDIFFYLFRNLAMKCWFSLIQKDDENPGSMESKVQHRLQKSKCQKLNFCLACNGL